MAINKKYIIGFWVKGLAISNIFYPTRNPKQGKRGLGIG
jgi:hypothetical protein